MDKKSLAILILSCICVILAAITIFLGYLFLQSQHQLVLTQQKQVFDTKVLAFRDMFTRNIILSGKEVDFNTRLAMETSVRALNDAQIFDQWQKFTQAETPSDASSQAKKLLELLIEKISNS
jgi:hypothetical protein